MNLVGKIFVVLIMVMSLVFSAFAVVVFSTHQNWREEVTRKPTEVQQGQKVGLVYQLAEEKERFAELEAEKERLKHELTALRAAKAQVTAKLEAERLRLAQERNDLAAKYAQIAATREDTIAALRLAQTNLNRLGERIDSLRDSIKVAHGSKDVAFNQILLKSEELNIALGQLELLKRRNNELLQQVAKLDELIEKGGAGGPATPPRVEGFVTAVSNEKKLAEISLGTDDGVNMGNQLEVYRGGAYVGQLVIVKTTPDRAVGKFARLVKPMNRGDKVTTRGNLNVAVAN